MKNGRNGRVIWPRRHRTHLAMRKMYIRSSLMYVSS